MMQTLKNILIQHLTMVLLTFIALIINASPSDNMQQITITSDKFEIDYIAGHAKYQGNVKFQQGTRILNASELFVHFESSDQKQRKPKKQSQKTSLNLDNSQALTNNLTIKEIKALGNPVEYQEQLKNNNGTMYAEAKMMKFTPRKNLVTLQDNAQIKQNDRLLTSELLHYNIQTEVAYSPKQENKRNKLIIG